MRLTSAMIVPDAVADDDARIRQCPQCGVPTWHAPQKVMVLSASGARSMRLWTCEQHPLPGTITDDPQEES